MNKLLFLLSLCIIKSLVISQTDNNVQPDPTAVNCLRRLEVDVMQCSQEVEQKYKFGEDNMLNEKAWCCRNWMSSQCALKPVFVSNNSTISINYKHFILKEKCNQTEVKEVLVWFVHQINELNDEKCKDTPFDTKEC